MPAPIKPNTEAARAAKAANAWQRKINAAVELLSTTAEPMVLTRAEAARAAKAANAWQRKINAAVVLLSTTAEPMVLTRADVAELIQRPEYRNERLAAYLCGYFGIELD